MEEWKEYKLGDVCDFQEGYVNPPQGIAEYFDGDIKWLRATDLNDGFVYNTSRTLTQLGFKSAKKSAILFKPGTIAISKSGTIGRLGILQDYMCGNRAVINIIPDDTVDTYFIFCTLRNYQKLFPTIAVGSVQKNLYISILEELKISIPSLSGQKKIASFLRSIDDKIDCNRRINDNLPWTLWMAHVVLLLLKLKNDNLEQQAQALFKSWFVDFEPFKNGEFVESELGMIPKKWKVGKLGELCQFKRGKNLLSKDAVDGGVPVVAGGLEPSCYHNVSNTKSPVVTISGSGANAGFMRMYHQEVWASDCSFIDSSCDNLLFVYCFLAANRRLLRHAQTGAVQPHVKPADIHDFDVVIPPADVIEDFQYVIAPSIETKGKNEQESRRLAQLRDTLLPRLMSGELKVNEL
jgi:type I restriction enzyme S subunit